MMEKVTGKKDKMDVMRQKNCYVTFMYCYRVSSPSDDETKNNATPIRAAPMYP